MPPKMVIEHRDKLGQLLRVGDAVCFPDQNSLNFGIIKKLNVKMVTVWETSVNHWSWYKGNRKYPYDLVKVEGPNVTIYLLKNGFSQP